MFGIDDILDIIKGPIGTVVDRLVPDNNAAQKLKNDIAEAVAKADISAALAQLDINKTEASSSSVFVAGWRPYIGWVGGMGFAVQFVIVPLVSYGYALTGHPAPQPITLDPMLWEVIFGILGLNVGARTYEKIKGVAT